MRPSVTSRNSLSQGTQEDMTTAWVNTSRTACTMLGASLAKHRVAAALGLLGSYLLREALLPQWSTVSSALTVRADVYYGTEEVEPIHDAHHVTPIGDDHARDRLTYHLVGGDDFTGAYLYVRDLRAHDLAHRPLGHPSKVVDPLVPGLGDEGDVLHYLQVVGQRGGQKMAVGDETYRSPSSSTTGIPGILLSSKIPRASLS